MVCGQAGSQCGDCSGAVPRYNRPQSVGIHRRDAPGECAARSIGGALVTSLATTCVDSCLAHRACEPIGKPLVALAFPRCLQRSFSSWPCSWSFVLFDAHVVDRVELFSPPRCNRSACAHPSLALLLPCLRPLLGLLSTDRRAPRGNC